MNFHIVERLGGSSRCATLLTFAIHFLHALFTMVNYLAWVRRPEATLINSIRVAYLALGILCCIFYFLGASVFYMWAWRFPEPEEVAKRRRVYGVGVNLFFCDLPVFILETRIVWQLQFPAAIMAFNYCLTCVSLCYSVLRVWFFFMVRVIKFRLPTSTAIGANYPTRAAVVARREAEALDYGGGDGGPDGRAYGYGVTPPSAAAGNTILLNRNAALYSDDGASGTGLYSTPHAERGRGDVYYHYGASEGGRHAFSSDDLSGAQGSSQQRYRRGWDTSIGGSPSAAPPSRI
ncbi:hypothetical protein NESM_000630200 [Novymonas esmeraldas]|uniref:Uncharacterized protein n=1 Tax=Novymonas esmeraldas TaxID=1808958 RepID=A0AAW0ET20_9TRYP